jgi:hypothetical protein
MRWSPGWLITGTLPEGSEDGADLRALRMVEEAPQKEMGSRRRRPLSGLVIRQTRLAAVATTAEWPSRAYGRYRPDALS